MVPGTIRNVERRGSGPPLLLIHGVGHRWQAWTPLLDDLARDHDVVAVDLPGFGKSPALDVDHPLTIADVADALERLLDELGWDRAHTVVVRKRGCGHIPMWDDPSWCIDTIRATGGRPTA